MLTRKTHTQYASLSYYIYIQCINSIYMHTYLLTTSIHPSIPTLDIQQTYIHTILYIHNKTKGQLVSPRGQTQPIWHKCCCRGQSVSRAENRKHSSCGVVEQGLAFTRTPQKCIMNKPFIGIGPLFSYFLGVWVGFSVWGLPVFPNPTQL